ncbi:hypothetical protein ACMHYB_38670 [Sorangium sp. So ce1128]
MYTSPNVAQMLKSVVGTLRRDVLPHVEDPEAVAKAAMCVAILQWAERLAPVEQQLYVREIKEMSDLFSALGHMLESNGSPEGRRIQDRGRTMPAKASFAVPASYDTLLEAHRALSEALIPTVEDLHALADQGGDTPREALTMVRRHLARRVERDVAIYLGAPEQGAMVGRE